MLELLPYPAIWAPVALFVGYVVYQLFLKPSPLPDLPVIGRRPGDWFPGLQAGWRNALDFRSSLDEMYTQYKDQAVILPLADGGDMVVLPACETQFVTDQPESVLSMHEMAQIKLQTDYTVMDPSLVHNPVHTVLITTKLTNQIGNLVPDLFDEVAYNFDKHWGNDEGYREISVYETMRRIVGGVTNYAFLGRPACRDPALIDLGMAYAQDVPLTSRLLRLFPQWLRPLIAPVVTLPCRIHSSKFEALVRPTVLRRLEEYEARKKGSNDSYAGEIPNDFLEWSIQQAEEIGDPKLSSPKTLALRILMLNFAAIHTSSFTATQAILDLVSSKPEYLAELRHEISSVLAEFGGEWNKRALAKMEKLDSALRESVRLNTIATVALNRLVVAEDGITTPSGIHLPKGTEIGVPGYSVHMDDEIFPDAAVFKPFRFSEARRDESTEYVQRARNAVATTSTEFLAFGHGRFACPGRFFAANEIKLILAYLLLNYDMEMQATRPDSFWFGLARVPPRKATIRMRRKRFEN